jgi:hypothetical protein
MQPIVNSIAALALCQLREWEVIAEQWYTEVTDDGYLRCGACTQAIVRKTDRHGTHYDLSAPEILALTVAHIRQNHAEVINGAE